MNTLDNAIKYVGELLFLEMEYECDGSYVGAEGKTKFRFSGTNYELEITAFWEKSRWYEYQCTSAGISYSGTNYL